MDPVQIDLYEFLTESELQHYYNSIKNELKISNASQFKYATDEDLKQIGMSRPEIRRLRKYYEKYFPHGYLSKIKRLLQAPATIVRRDDGSPPSSQLPLHSSDAHSTATNAQNSPGKGSNNKHIIPADSICVNKQLGTGEFGIVQQGVWTNGSERIQVAIKCLCRERMQSNPMEFLKEAAIMHSIEHENIVRLYGVVLATDSLMLVTELAHLRSLLECLKDSGLRVSFLTIPTLCEFAVQICNGMKYLEQKRLIHRDLAARNILVFNKNKVKISDFGLSRALGVGKDYYKTNFNVNLKLPIAWCAPECINYLRFTNASDVWAYGVCLWEMFSYGFQPWAALTGLQILEAIDAPNFQRLEQPECCPRDYYQLMMNCWQDDPLNRPKFSEIYEMLPEIKPEQLKAVFNCGEPKKDHLLYRQGDIITVLDRNTNMPFWKGALNSGKTGLFNPANTVAYLESLPSSNRDSFCRTNERCSKRKLRTEMISKPQNDLKHTGHMGIDGDSFGDVAFLVNSQNYNHLPRQIVTPYKPSEDIEQTPLLLPPTPTSPDSLQTASSYFPEEGSNSSTNPTFVPSNENTPKQIGSFEQSKFDFSAHQLQQQQQANPSSMPTNPFTNNHSKSSSKTASFALQNNNYDIETNEFNEATGNEGASSTVKRPGASWASSSGSNLEEQHEYHEISDDDAADKFDFGPSLLDEINSMFGSIGTSTCIPTQPKSPNVEQINIKNELAECTSKLNQKLNSGGNSGKTGTSKKKGACSVKPISVKDEKILNQAIEIANEISARSMTDLVCEQAPSTQSPKRKFSFRFPHLSSHYGSNEKNTSVGHAGAGCGSTPSSNTTATNESQGNANACAKEKKNFTEELKNIPDLQRFRSLTEIQKSSRSDIRIPLFDKESSDFCFQKSHEILTRPFIGMRSRGNNDSPKTTKSLDGDILSENIHDIESTLKAINFDFMKNYNELDKTDSAETLLNEKLSSIVTSLEDEISSATGSHKSSAGFYETGSGTHTKFDFNAASSHLDRHLQFIKSPSSNSTHFDAIHENKVADDKRSTTPDTGFASRDTNLSLSRRSSQKSNYSPQEILFNAKDTQFVGNFSYMGLKNETALYGFESGADKKPRNPSKYFQDGTACADHTTIPKARNSALFANKRGSHPQRVKCDQFGVNNHRQRSMSFTDNYEITESMQSTEPAALNRKMQRSSVVLPQTTAGSFQCTPRKNIQAVMQRHVYKSRSIRARTLRRLSYNPIVLDTSSSSDEVSDYDRSTARSECDIRSHTTKSSRRRGRHYFNRKALSNSQDGRDILLAKEKIYGSNASIRSAPHYNYNGFRNPTTERYHQTYESTATGSYDREQQIYDFGGPGPGNNYTISAAGNNLIKPPKAFAVNTIYNNSGSGSSSTASSTAANSGSACSYVYEFDVSKLTGKSPTSNNFTNSSPEEKITNTSKTPPTSLPLPLPLIRNAANNRALHMKSSQTQNNDFHWPEKIRASSVQQSNFLWNQQRAATTTAATRTTPPAAAAVSKQRSQSETIRRLSLERRAYSSDDTSSTNSEEFEFRRDFLPHIPPSPAP